MSWDNDEKGAGVERPEETFESIYREEPDAVRCATCAHCAVSETVMFASKTKRKRYTCMRCPDFVHATQGLAKCNYWEELGHVD